MWSFTAACPCPDGHVRCVGKVFQRHFPRVFDRLVIGDIVRLLRFKSEEEARSHVVSYDGARIAGDVVTFSSDLDATYVDELSRRIESTHDADEEEYEYSDGEEDMKGKEDDAIDALVPYYLNGDGFGAEGDSRHISMGRLVGDSLFVLASSSYAG